MIGALILGALVGWIAGKLMNVEGGLLRNIVIGVVGSFVGSVVFSLIGFHAYGLVAELIVGVVGACPSSGWEESSFDRRKAPKRQRREQHAPGAQPFFRGKVQMKRVSRAELSARMAPLCASMMVLAIARPRPKPDFSPRDASAR